MSPDVCLFLLVVGVVLYPMVLLTTIKLVYTEVRTMSGSAVSVGFWIVINLVYTAYLLHWIPRTTELWQVIPN